MVHGAHQRLQGEGGRGGRSQSDVTMDSLSDEGACAAAVSRSFQPCASHGAADSVLTAEKAWG